MGTSELLIVINVGFAILNYAAAVCCCATANPDVAMSAEKTTSEKVTEGGGDGREQRRKPPGPFIMFSLIVGLYNLLLLGGAWQNAAYPADRTTFLVLIVMFVIWMAVGLLALGNAGKAVTRSWAFAGFVLTLYTIFAAGLGGI